MARLIDADALIASMGLENAVKWGNKDGYQQDHSYSTMMLYEIKDAIDCQPTVDAVPLEPLCEWLGMYVVPPVSGCLLTTEARTAAWKVVLNKFVEE